MSDFAIPSERRPERALSSPRVEGPEILVLGGGPAGAASARLLAAWGHDVRLLTRASSDVTRLAESIPPSCRKLFDLLGVREAIDAAGFVRTTGNTVWWADGDTRVERFAEGECGWQVTADALAGILRQAASDAGARIERVRVTADDAMAFGAAMILDCTGRAGALARSRGWRVYEPAHRTVALVGAWSRGGDWPLPDPSHTLIESYVDGWAWSVPLGVPSAAAALGAPLADLRRHIAVMVDPQATALARGQAPRAIYLAELAKTRRLASLVEDAVLEGGPWGWDASMYAATRYADDQLLLVGDAGSFLDPLSSAGVKKALASGWLAAIVAHTCLARPAMRDTALEFFGARETEIYESFRRLTQRYLGDAAAGHAHPFWTDRAGPLDPADSSAVEREDDRTFSAIHAAHARLRAAPALSVQRGADLRIARRPAVSGCEIVLESRLVTDDRAEGIRYYRDVDLITLIELAPDFRQVPDVFEAYCRRTAPVALPDFLAALAYALARGWLVLPGDS